MKEGNVTASYSESAGGVGGDSDRRIWPSEDNSSGLRKTDMKERCCTWGSDDVLNLVLAGIEDANVSRDPRGPN